MPMALLQRRILVDRDIVESLALAVGPDHANFHGTTRVAQPHEHARVARRRVAAVTASATPHRPGVAGGDCYAGAPPVAADRAANDPPSDSLRSIAPTVD